MAAALFVVIIGSLADSATADDSAMDWGSNPDEQAESERRTIEGLAAAHGLSMEDAEARYGWNDDFARLVQTVRERHPDSYASSEILDKDSAVISFDGSAPALDELEEWRAFSDKFGDIIAVATEEGAGFTERELDQTMVDTHYLALGTPGVRDVVTVAHGGAIDVVVLGDEGQPVDALLAEVSAAITNDATSRIEVSVRATTAASLGGEDSSSYHRGGELLSGGCTSAFISNNNGWITAAHCGGTQKDDGTAENDLGAHFGSWGDVQHHVPTGSGVDPAYDDYYQGSSSTTETNLSDVAYRGIPVQGQGLCGNGATNHRTCADVYRTSTCRSSACRLVMLGNRSRAPGDSGGPWYTGTTAVGIHSGWSYYPSWPFDRDQFSRVEYTDEAMNVTVATTP